MNRPTSLLVVLPCLVVMASGGAPAPLAGQAMARSNEWEIAATVLAIPEVMRDGAEVRLRGADGSLRTIREGSNQIICLSDVPGDGGFQATCYHASLEPFMARGRELRAEGLSGMPYQQKRWEEARAGSLQMPDGPAMVFNLSFESEDFDPATTDPATGGRLHAVYIPNATPESTGLPTNPRFGGPWLMWPGEPSSHIMVSIPPSGGR